jgi:hypothetical protein
VEQDFLLLLELINDLRIAKERLSSGILTEQQTFDDLLDKLLYGPNLGE